MSEDKKKSGEPADAELNDLLDSALEDFNQVQSDKPKTDATAVASSAQLEQPDAAAGAEDQWTQDFIKQAADQFEKNLQNLIQNGDDNDLGASFQKMAQTVASAITGEGDLGSESSRSDFQSAISQALKDLSSTSQDLQNPVPGLGEADLAAMFGRTSLEEESGEFPSFMQGMMQSLLSKEVLYPTMKELVDKYPVWLEEKKPTLPAADFERYTEQLNLMQKVCAELENEKEDDSDEVKKARFEKTLALMNQMQNCGQPPEELVGAPALFKCDAEGNPVFPPGVDPPENCCVM
ncbi:peroxisomal biogenesis factor 19 [Neodiprion pinetum]|uniref:peroxisomal biogenesis factor 19 n=1 Tax=Neodiprion pinetum TaxID=441929 RepID=UPI001EDFE4B8|nr:peroxisomal biogenesis factor 19 [Neodiprion pinetum]